MWDLFILNPMINALLLLYDLLGTNFFLAIAVFTLLVRLLTLPLNMRQQRASMRMQEMQPQVQAIQKKYKDNPQKMQEEFQKIGYNPAESLLGCLPLLIQFPILIGLYRAIIVVLGSTPQALFELTQRVYDFIDLTALLPVNNQFYWLNLAQPDPIFVLPLLVLATTFLQQKLLSPQTKKDDDKKKDQEDDNPMAGMTQSMQYTMPLMFGFFALQFPAGLSLYFILSNVIGVGQGLLLRRSMDEAKAEATANGSNGKKPVSDEKGEEAVVAEDGAGEASKGSKQKKKSRARGKRR